MPKPKMLVVEDNELAGTTVTTLFEMMGFEVMLIQDGLQVLPYLENNRVTVVILDLELPGMTGDQIYRKMKEDPTLQYIPIVPFTAHRNTRNQNLTNNLVLTAYMKTRVIPEIIYKTSETGEPVDLNKQLVDEVAYALLNAKQEVTLEMAKYYVQTRQINPQIFIKE